MITFETFTQAKLWGENKKDKFLFISNPYCDSCISLINEVALEFPEKEFGLIKTEEWISTTDVNYSMNNQSSSFFRLTMAATFEKNYIKNYINGCN
jgi:hypothetical protein